MKFKTVQCRSARLPMNKNAKYNQVSEDWTVVFLQSVLFCPCSQRVENTEESRFVNLKGNKFRFIKTRGIKTNKLPLIVSNDSIVATESFRVVINGTCIY